MIRCYLNIKRLTEVFSRLVSIFIICIAAQLIML